MSFDAAVATLKGRGIEGKAVVIKDRETLLAAAGSRWTLVENLRLLHEALSSYQVDRAAVVCTPCQAHFLRQASTFPLVEGTDFSERLALILGLFCLGTFSQPSFAAFLRRRFGVSPARVQEVSLREGELRVQVEGEEAPLAISVSEALEFVNLGCLLCDGYTARDADVSAGAAAATPGWTVLVVRTERGERMLEEAKRRGYVETSPASEEVLQEIQLRAGEKLRRATEYKLRLF
ncbi:Coenzyme F420 hydrogenase/dehydrogenase, beta subunit C-terminal domain [Candidatus Bipolaricaulota bacterium]|nr:Coenzyme F420 hydrogenase/dehydrogenase, beta subunit C-terminal domain [Candidatus Bipolaricaulota bacterium]